MTIGNGLGQHFGDIFEMYQAKFMNPKMPLEPGFEAREWNARDNKPPITPDVILESEGYHPNSDMWMEQPVPAPKRDKNSIIPEEMLVSDKYTETLPEGGIVYKDQRDFEQEELMKLPEANRRRFPNDLESSEYKRSMESFKPGEDSIYDPRTFKSIEEATDKYPDGMILWRKHLPDKVPNDIEILEVPWARGYDNRLFMRKRSVPTS